MFVSQIRIVDPPFSKTQSESFEWLASSYSRYQKDQGFSKAAYAKLLSRVGCGEERISKRHYFLEDFHKKPEDSDIFKSGSPGGASDRQAFFQTVSEKVFSDLYETRSAPAHLIHVTCTGYVSPSGAQLVAARKFPTTVVTHSYHMGCSGAFPALRMAGGFLNNPSLPNAADVDVVHTELCSLHMMPVDPTLEQMVIQSLFADGVAAYRVSVAAPEAPHFELLSLGEFILPETADAMQWTVADQGMAMTLSKDVPAMIGAALRETLVKWEKQTGHALLSELPKMQVAVHPGGPKIIDAVAELLELSPVQVEHSHAVLFERGNMSSATVPHVWAKMLADEKIADGTLVLSMAFGPGLTLCLSLMRLQR